MDTVDEADVSFPSDNSVVTVDISVATPEFCNAEVGHHFGCRSGGHEQVSFVGLPR